MRLYPRIKIGLLAIAAALSMTIIAQAQPTIDVERALAERSVGAADAPVTVIEYFSLTCPYCAAFHLESYPEVKQRYVDAGKVRVVYHDFPLDGVALRAAMMSRCVDPARYSGILKVLYQTQGDWSRAADPVAALARIGRLAGLGEDAFAACMNDEALVDGILAMRQEASSAGLRSTPSFEINGKLHAGALSPEEFAEIVDPLLANN